MLFMFYIWLESVALRFPTSALTDFWLTEGHQANVNTCFQLYLKALFEGREYSDPEKLQKRRLVKQKLSESVCESTLFLGATVGMNCCFHDLC